MKEIWAKYTANISVPDDYYEVSELKQNQQGTQIILEGENNVITALFSFVDSLRVSDEGRRIVTYHETEGIQEYRETFSGNPFYKVQHSSYSKWMEEESAGIYSDSDHYAIVTRNEIIDILTIDIPIITIKNIKE